MGEKEMREEDAVAKRAPVKEPAANVRVNRSAVDKLLSVLEKESILGMVVLFAMMMLTVVDVVGRYFFNRPVQGTNEITGLLLVLVAASALAFSQIKKGHIRVDLITGRLSPRGQMILDAIAYLFCLFGSALITWQTVLRGISYMQATRGNLTETLNIPFFPFMLILGLGFFLLAVVALIDFIRSLVKAVKK
jgi:TRAP-type C4-dicarboxylate transport system permease small subunit